MIQIGARMTRPLQRVYRVLLVDDSEDDRLLLCMRLRHHQRLQIIAELSDGRQAIAYLSGEGPYGNREMYPLPDLMLLDLKMPHVTGYEVLEWLQTESFPDLRVLVLSGSFLPEDIAKTLDLGADAYRIKASHGEQQHKLLDEMEALLDGEPIPRSDESAQFSVLQGRQR